MTVSSSQRPRRKFAPSIWLATALIGLYQRYISPYKGFRCAHRVLHGSRSCSSYAKFMIQQQGILGARPHIRQRFADCSAAARILRHQASSNDPERQQRRQNAFTHCCDGCYVGDCNIPALECGWFDQDQDGQCDLFSDCDLTPDCGDLSDCGSLADCGDCGGCDVGSCDVGCCDIGSCG